MRALNTNQKTNLANCEGAAAVEFAIVGAFLATFFLGAAEVAGLIEDDRRVMRVSASVGDLASRASVLDENALDQLFFAARQIAYPLDVKDMRIRLSSVSEVDGELEVIWSVQCNWPQDLDADSTLSIPPAVEPSAGNAVLMAEIEMDAPSAYGALSESGITLTDVAYALPRDVMAIPLAPAGLDDDYECPIEP